MSAVYRRPGRTRPAARPERRHRRGGLAAALLLFACATGPALATAAEPPAVRYVAMGDSAAAAALVPPQTSLSCLRSGENYPHLVARELHPASFADVTCSGARTTTLGPQLAALSPETTLVTLTIGANDVGIVQALALCSLLGAARPHGHPCRDTYRHDGRDGLEQRADAAGPQVGAALDAVHRRAPSALVLLVGYLDVFPAPPHGCRPRETFADGDLAHLDAVENRLDATLSRTARAHHAVFVGLHPASAGHDFCARDGVRWSEALVPTRPTAPFHPNHLGEQAMARETLTALRASS
ncbi:SGNH/GDSL hydrolase family protein [Streptomyces cinnamoneus]|uniref:SGNH/GDSL hydrolase family protein n=1 Tax=Streptomyces cinnamoneus TaxID=53446 RepID=UPI0037AAFF60